jgi:hypothetical protein
MSPLHPRLEWLDQFVRWFAVLFVVAAFVMTLLIIVTSYFGDAPLYIGDDGIGRKVTNKNEVFLYSLLLFLFFAAIGGGMIWMTRRPLRSPSSRKHSASRSLYVFDRAKRFRFVGVLLLFGPPLAISIVAPNIVWNYWALVTAAIFALAIPSVVKLGLWHLFRRDRTTFNLATCTYERQTGVFRRYHTTTGDFADFDHLVLSSVEKLSADPEIGAYMLWSLNLYFKNGDELCLEEQTDATGCPKLAMTVQALELAEALKIPMRRDGQI